MEIDKQTMQGFCNFYKKIHKLGRVINAAREREMHLNNPEQFKILTDQMTDAVIKCKRYLDKEGLKLPQPLWVFSIDDQTTWLSSQRFNAHLLSEAA